MSVIGSKLAPLFWTNRQNIRTPEQFSSTVKGLYSSVLNAMDLPKGVIMGKLEGKVAVITGGATGIGLAAAKRFIEEGAFVFIFGRRQEALDAAVADLGPNARAVKGSVSDEADLDRLYAAVKAQRGTLDIVFANAGAGSPLPLGKITAEHIDETLDTNVKGTIFTVQKALPLMGKGGSIILTGSSAGTTGAPTMSVYSASKAAVRNLARTWAEDLKGTGIRVNVLSPGPTATELAKEALGEEGQSVATTRDPESFASDAAAVGPEVVPTKLADAVKADIIFLAVRFESHPDVAKALPTWQGKTIIDVTNAYGVPPQEPGGQPSSKFVAQDFTGGRLVKGFNHLVAAVLDQDPAVHGGRRVVFLASDDDGAAAEIGALAENLGFVPIKLGGLSEGGLLVQARGNSWGQLIFKDLVKFD